MRAAEGFQTISQIFSPFRPFSQSIAEHETIFSSSKTHPPLYSKGIPGAFLT